MTVVHHEKLLVEMQGANTPGRGTMNQLFILTTLMKRAHKKRPSLI